MPGENGKVFGSAGATATIKN